MLLIVYFYDYFNSLIQMYKKIYYSGGVFCLFFKICGQKYQKHTQIFAIDYDFVI